MRYASRRWLRGVGFVDVSNVYPGRRDISLTRFWLASGAGVRIDTPFGVIRLDVGVSVNPRSIDPRGGFIVGFGHAF